MSSATGGRVRRTAVTVWAVGFSLYVLAVFHRTSLAVAGLVARDRFDLSAAQLATFVVVQLFVYASLQIPVGLAIDRFGPRRVLTCGVIAMSLGQLLFAVAETVEVAVSARILVGAGDAMTFACVLRLVATWFPAARVAIWTQVTGIGGQLGAIAATVPMTYAFSHWGWTPTYALAGGIGFVLLIALLVVVHDSPEARRERGAPLSWAVVRRSLGQAWAHPGTRLAFWTHFVTPFSATAFGMLWGYPYLVRAEGVGERTASLLLLLLVVSVVLSGFGVSWVVTRHPYHRSDLVLAIVLAMTLAWTLVLAWPGQAPLPVLALLVTVIAIGGPASTIGFEYGREYNDRHRLGAAIGIINQAGFFASLAVVIAIGLVLDARTPAGQEFAAEAFAPAMACQYPLWALGAFQVWRWRRRTRRFVAAEDVSARD